MRYFISLIFSCCLLLLTGAVHAETGGTRQVYGQSVSIYAEPQTKSKIITTIAQGHSLIPVFEQKDWVKVANPDNGDIGWVQKTIFDQNTRTVGTVNNNANVREYLITNKDKDGKAQGTYRIITYSNTKPLDEQQAQALFNRIKEQQRRMQESFNRMMDDAFHDFGIRGLYRSWDDDDMGFFNAAPDEQTVAVKPTENSSTAKPKSNTR